MSCGQFDYLGKGSGPKGLGAWVAVMIFIGVLDQTIFRSGILTAIAAAGTVGGYAIYAAAYNGLHRN